MIVDATMGDQQETNPLGWDPQRLHVIPRWISTGEDIVRSLFNKYNIKYSQNEYYS